LPAAAGPTCRVPNPRVMKELVKLEVAGRAAWRAWLQKNHASSPGVWLVYRKGAAAAKSIGYEDSVREALCFGWVDSLIRRLDAERYARKFTKRKATSTWSDSNIARWNELEAVGCLAAAGREAAPTAKRYAARPAIPDLPRYIRDALSLNGEAWTFFKTLPPSHRREFITWIHTAKRPETRERRILETIRLLQRNKKLGLK